MSDLCENGDCRKRTFRSPLSFPSAPTSATQTSVSSHGMLGWSQVTQARREPSGLSRGAA